MMASSVWDFDFISGIFGIANGRIALFSSHWVDETVKRAPLTGNADEKYDDADATHALFSGRAIRSVASSLPAIAHFDGTARPQTVTRDVDPWLHALLKAVKAETGWGVLVNTSFNTKGKPILNTLVEALTLLRDGEDLDYVLVEDWLFSKSLVVTAAAQGYLPDQ